MSGFAFKFDVAAIIKFPKVFWVSVGSWIVNQIRKDAGQGIFQTDLPHKKTYSHDYAVLKENRMKQVVGFHNTGKNAGKPKREKLKEYKGVSIASTNTSFVDMTLTGRTLRGLHIKESSESGVTLTYKPEDVEKIVSNQRPKYNRRLVGLNKKNRTKLKKMVLAQIKKQLIRQVVGKKTINMKM